MTREEAPKKIYVCDDVFPSHVDWEGSPINTKRIDNHDIEYIRTDVFIKKAVEWIRNNCYFPHATLEYFKNYMKGE